MAKHHELSSLWLDPSSPAAFTGRYNLIKEAKKHGISKEEVDRFLETQIAYTRHFPRRFKFSKNFYNISKWGHLLELDLAEITGEASKANKNIRYLLVGVETLSRKLFVKPLKNKTGASTADALQSILDQCPPIEIVRSDLGREFRSKEVQDLLKSRGIKQNFSSHQSKASLVERLIQSFRRRIGRYLTYKNTYVFLPVLDQIVQGYNNTVHSSTGFAPNEVRKEHEFPIWQKVFENHMKKQKIVKPKFKIGQTVRLALEPNAMVKSYHGNFTQEVFRIKAIRHTNPPTYQLRDLLGQDLSSEVYEQEVVPVVVPEGEDAKYEIARVLQRRTRGGVK